MDTSVTTFVFKTGVLGRTTNVHYPSDNYGRGSVYDQEHIGDPEQWLTKENTRMNNERMIKNGINALEWIDTLYIANHQWVIAGLTQRFGPRSPWDNRPWTDVIKDPRLAYRG